MKKSNLVCGIVYTFAGVICLIAAIAALFTDTKLDSILFGLAGAGIVPGLVMIYKYFYWSSPKRSQKYQEMLENERIEWHDELKEKIRDKSGRYTYALGLLITSAAIVVFTILGEIELVEGYRMIVLYLFGYLVVQIVAGIAIFNYLLKKYK